MINTFTYGSLLDEMLKSMDKMGVSENGYIKKDINKKNAADDKDDNKKISLSDALKDLSVVTYVKKTDNVARKSMYLGGFFLAQNKADECDAYNMVMDDVVKVEKISPMDVNAFFWGKEVKGEVTWQKVDEEEERRAKIWDEIDKLEAKIDTLKKELGA